MKKSLLTLAIAFVLGVASASATCWRINPSEHSGAQFKTVEDAMADLNVLAGDTLLLDPVWHGDIALRRDNITIIGAGYFLDQNRVWVENQSTILGTVSLTSKSKIEGCVVNRINLANNVNIKRCHVNLTYGSGMNAKQGIIEQCYFTGEIAGLGNDWVVRNNIVIQQGGYNPAIYGNYDAQGKGTIIENNVFLTNTNIVIYNFRDAIIRNNIIINTKAGFDENQVPYAASTVSFTDNNIIQNNVFSTPERYANTEYPSNLYVGATIENTFVNEGSEDAKWQLLESSAAKGAATHGGDCGAFGGPTPYVLSGIPQFLPHITEALIPAKPTDGKITVKLKIANQNE